MRSGAVPAVIKLLYHASPDGKFSALLMTKNLVVNGFEDTVFHHGGVIAVARMFDADLHELHYTESFHFHKEVAKTLYELSVGRDDIKKKIIDAGVIPKLVPLLDHPNDRLKSATLKTLYGLAVNSSAKVRGERRQGSRCVRAFVPVESDYRNRSGAEVDCSSLQEQPSCRVCRDSREELGL